MCAGTSGAAAGTYRVRGVPSGGHAARADTDRGGHLCCGSLDYASPATLRSYRKEKWVMGFLLLWIEAFVFGVSCIALALACLRWFRTPPAPLDKHRALARFGIMMFMTVCIAAPIA